MEQKIETHPFDPFIPHGANKLIIGSIPPSRFCLKSDEEPKLNKADVNFYYGSQDNSFWKLLQDIFSVEFEYKNNLASINQRKDFLTNVGLGITDIVKSCKRKNNSAQDKDLFEITHKDLKTLLEKFNEIHTLIYTSEFIKKNVNNLFNTYHTIDKNNKKKQFLKLGDKNYKIRILYSPSPSGLRRLGKNGSEKRKSQYSEFLTND